MNQPSTVFLMYHELELSGRPLCQSEPGYVRYVLSASAFEEQMRWLRQSGWRGSSVGDALGNCEKDRVVVTFDDGCETDLMVAAPLLHQLGFGATFYLTVGFLNRPGYLSHSQAKELSGMGFEIGCHSMSHPYLGDLSDQALDEEIALARQRLEQIAGCEVRHFSCPGGRWDTRVARVALRAGYRSVATSQYIANTVETDPFCLGRVAIMRGTSTKDFFKLCRAEGLWAYQVRDAVRASAKRVLGNSFYDHVRSALLARSK
jgi:peptidoglycan/xylan/chitin deacetylase (PgdA/CDA1 family)